MNVLTAADVQAWPSESVLFVKDETGFTIRLLRYFDALQFRGKISADALRDCLGELYSDAAVRERWNILFGEARMLYAVLRDMAAHGGRPPTGSVEIGSEITKAALEWWTARGTGSSGAMKSGGCVTSNARFA